jgi:hypothetical protein
METMTDFIIGEAAKYRGEAEDPARTIGDLLAMFVEGRLDVFPEYQRGAVLDAAWARDIVRTIISTPALISPVFLRESVDSDGTKRYEVVDGAQRLTAVLLYAMGALSVPFSDGSVAVDVHGRASDEAPCGYSYLFGSGAPRCSDMMDDGVCVYDSMYRFAEFAEGVASDQSTDRDVMDQAEYNKFQNKTIRTIVFPTSWPDRLCILYCMYAELKHIRQTKDECLLHLHDLASRELKALEPLADAAAVGLGIDAASRKPYGWLFKVFAMLDGATDVPTDANERMYMPVMCRTVQMYVDKPPCPSTIHKIRTAIEQLSIKSHKVKAKFKRMAIPPDVACILLWKLCGCPSASVDALARITRFAARCTKRQRLEIGIESLGDAKGAEACEKYNVARLCGDLHKMAAIAATVA